MAKDTENAGGDEPIELTDREKAICRGEDPDSREAGTADDSADDAASENSDSGADEGGGVDESGDGKQDAVAGGKDAATPSSWIDDTVRLAARPYGMTDDDLGGFSSADEFRRAAAFLDKQSKRAAEAGDKPVDTVTDAAAGAASPSLDVQQYIDAGWDDATVNLVKYAKGLRDELDQLKPIAGQLKETQDSLQRQQLHSFHDILDRMDEALYGRSMEGGKSVPLGDDHRANRKTIFDTMKKLAAGESAVGGDIPPLPVLLGQAEQVVFGEELRQRDKKSLQAKIAAQSRRKRSVASGAGSASSSQAKQQPTTAKQIANSAPIKEMWNQFQEENGAE